MLRYDGFHIPFDERLWSPSGKPARLPRLIEKFCELAPIQRDHDKPSMSESIGQFQWSGGFHLNPDSKGLIEITLRLGVEKVTDPLVKQALQFLEIRRGFGIPCSRFLCSLFCVEEGGREGERECRLRAGDQGS